MRWLIVAILIIAVWFVFSFAKKNQAQNNELKERFTVVTKSLESTLSLSGTVDAEEKAILQFATSGKLAWVGVKEGDTVSKWQALASLDQRELQQNLRKKLYDFSSTRWDYDQFRDDNKSQETNQSNLYLTDELTRLAQKEQFGLEKSIIDVELAQLSIDFSTLISPINGIVTSIDQPLAGVNITPATARFEVVNPETLYLRVIVDQQDIVQLKKDMPAKIVFDSFADKTYSGQIFYLSFTPAEGEDSSYLVKFSLPENVKSELRLGMAAEINLITGRSSSATVVPFMAITQDGSRSYVMVEKANGKLQKKQVFTGLENDEYVEIKRGLVPGEVVAY